MNFDPIAIGCPISKFELHHPIAIGSIFSVRYSILLPPKLAAFLSGAELF